MATPAEARDVTLALLTARAQGATICPSEGARALTGADGQKSGDAGWRVAMPAVHTAIDVLSGEGLVGLSWQGQELAA